MKKLIHGLIEFRKKLSPERISFFEKISKGQAPDALFITCSDSRVAPNWFASTDPGDLFVVRNVGNLIPPVGAEYSVEAAIQFAVVQLKVKHIIVCGHSNCGAMLALHVIGEEGVAREATLKAKPEETGLLRWLRHGARSLRASRMDLVHVPSLAAHDCLSQTNVLEQIDSLLENPLVRDRVSQGELRVHGWWFDIAHASVFAYERSEKAFVLIDEAEGERILTSMH